MANIFEPEVRDRAIETTCSNLVMARQLEPTEVFNYMAMLRRLEGYELAKALVYSRALLDIHLRNDWSLN